MLKRKNFQTYYIAFYSDVPEFLRKLGLEGLAG